MQYLIKLNGNFNVLIKDINVQISHAKHRDGIVLNDTQYNRSNHLRELVDKGYLTVTELKSIPVKSKVETPKTTSKPIVPHDGTFIANFDESKFRNPGDVFIRYPDEDSIALSDGQEARVLDEVKISELGSDKNDIDVAVANDSVSEGKKPPASPKKQPKRKDQ